MRMPALSEHVRTARLVVAAAARRVGVDEAGLDAIRLAVDEACARATLRAASRSADAASGHGAAAPDSVVAGTSPDDAPVDDHVEPLPADGIEITMVDEDGWFVVEVGEPANLVTEDPDVVEELDLAARVIDAVAPECSERVSGQSLITRMAWPLA